MDLPEYKKRWNEWISSLYVNSKYEYHKNHDKYLVEDSLEFSQFINNSQRICE